MRPVEQRILEKKLRNTHSGVLLPKLLDLLLHSSLTTVPYILRRGQMHRYAKYCAPWILPFPGGASGELCASVVERLNL